MLEELVARAFKFRLRRPRVYDMERARSRQPAGASAPAPRRSSQLRRRCLQQQQTRHDRPPPATQVVYEDDVCVGVRSGAPRDALHLLVLPRRPQSPSHAQHEETLATLVLTAARLGRARSPRGFRLLVEGAAGGSSLQVHVMSDTPG